MQIGSTTEESCVADTTAMPRSHLMATKEKFGRFLDRLLRIDLENKLAQRIFRSSHAIEAEKQRQKKENRFIIHPFSPFRWYWDMVMVFTLTVTLLVLPVEIAFYSEEDGHSDQKWMIFNIIVDSVFLLDMLLNFRTAYVQGGLDDFNNSEYNFDTLVEIRSSLVAFHYFRTWFILDIASSLPLDYIYEMCVEQDESSDSFYLTLKILRLTKLLSLLRILRVARLMRYVHKLEELLDVEGKVISIVNLVATMLVFCHWNGCLQYLAAFLEGFPDRSWARRDNLVVVIDDIALTNATTIWHRYTRSVWRAMSHMLSIGYGLFPPETTTDTWVVMISMTLGATFYALFIAHMSMLIMTLDFSGRKYEEMISEVKQYMKFRRVPLPVQHRVLNYYDHKYQRKYFDESSLLQGGPAHLSHPLKQEILLHNCKDLVSKVPFLSNAPMDFLYDIILKLEFQVFFPEDVIMTEGKRGDSMYFIEHGTVEVVNCGAVVNTLGDGAFFGEIALLLDERRSASVIAIEVCDTYRLSKTAFDHVLREYPHMVSVFQRLAHQRLLQLDPAKEDVRRNSTRLVEMIADDKSKTKQHW